MNSSISTYNPIAFYRTRSGTFYGSTFTGKERDEETGFTYHGVRYYDATLLTAWTAVDPMADKYPSISPYAYCAWNPIKLVDPDGREFGDFYNSKGELIGNDGKSDGKCYLLKQTKSSFDSKPGANGEGAKVDNISQEEFDNTVSFIKTNSGDATAFTQDCIAYANSTEMLPFNVLDDVTNAIATHPKCNNVELGGAISPDKTIVNFVVGETDNCQVGVRSGYDIAWFHSHIPDKKKHSGYNESILDRHDRYHAPSYSDTQLFKNTPGYVFDLQNNRIYLLKDGLIKGYINNPVSTTK